MPSVGIVGDQERRLGSVQQTPAEHVVRTRGGAGLAGRVQGDRLEAARQQRLAGVQGLVLLRQQVQRAAHVGCRHAGAGGDRIGGVVGSVTADEIDAVGDEVGLDPAVVGGAPAREDTHDDVAWSGPTAWNIVHGADSQDVLGNTVVWDRVEAVMASVRVANGRGPVPVSDTVVPVVMTAARLGAGVVAVIARALDDQVVGRRMGEVVPLRGFQAVEAEPGVLDLGQVCIAEPEPLAGSVIVPAPARDVAVAVVAQE